MLPLSYYVVLGCVACVQVGSWLYFRRYQISSPPIGVFNVQDLAVMVLLIILVPLFYLILPLWLTAALLLLVATSILYFTWEPLLRARWAIWLATVTLLVVDSGAAFLGTKQNAFFAVNNIVLLVMGMGITNLWAQSGMKARDAALLGVLLALYDFIATVKLPLMGELVARLSDLPSLPSLPGAVRTRCQASVWETCCWQPCFRWSCSKPSVGLLGWSRWCSTWLPLAPCWPCPCRVGSR
jgi:hypothetical protein